MNDASEVKLHFLDYWRIIKLRAGLIALAFLLVMITAGVTTYFLPREYFSKVRMEVKMDHSGPITVFEMPTRPGSDPTFVPTQFQILQTNQILDPVIDKLKLVEEWSKRENRPLQRQTVRLKLIKNMELREVRNTGLIDIGVYSIEPQEAANIANMIALVYQEERVNRSRKALERGLGQLRDEGDNQRTRVEEALTQLREIRERDNVTDPDPENPISQISTKDRNIIELEKQLSELRFQEKKTKGELEQIEKMRPEELKEVLRTLNIADETVFKMVASLQEARSEEAKLSNQGLGENHPRIRALQAQSEVFSSQLAEQLNSVKRNHAARLETLQRTIDDLEATFTVAQNEQIADKKKTSAYSEAKSKYLLAKKVYEAAQAKISTALLEGKIDHDTAFIHEKAEPSLYPAKPNVPAYMALAAIVGLIIGLGLAFFIEYLDTSVKTLEDVEKYLDIPVLAVIPKDIATLIKTTGDSPDAEAYRILRANIEFNKPDKNAKTLTLVSGGPGEGKSTTLNNLAFTCAKGGYNVLVVDADLRRPVQHRFFDQDNGYGLTDYLTGKATLDEVTRTTRIDNLSFIPSGELPPEAVGILNSQRMVELISKVKQHYDLVFFDAPPILGVSDGSVLASECDITIMVVQHRRFPRAMLQRVKQAVGHAGGTLIGVVLNNVDTKHDDGYGYFNQYTDYYATTPAEPARRAPAREPAAVAAPSRNGGGEEY